jgi:hypothetical protein
MRELARLVWEALFLSEAPYAEMRDSPRPALRGLGLVALVAAAVALVGLVGATLEWATSPSLADIQRTVLEGIQRMPWYEQMQDNQEFRQMFQQQWDMSWRIFPQLFGASSVLSGALRIVTLPVGLAFTWFLYGIVAHVCARLLGGQGSAGQVLGCTALAVAPQLLNLVTFFPYVVVGGVVGTWVVLCRYVALKTCHRLTWNRALAATLLPYVALAVVIASAACLGGVVVSLFVGGGTAQ